MTELGVVFYEGPSVLTGDPIVAVATGLEGGSRNLKTGPIVQTWMVRPDMAPAEAVRLNLDDAICGDCALRGHDGRDRGCYVTPWLAPNNVFKALDAYPVVTWRALRALVEGRVVRVGAYGDPVALPFEVWREVLGGASGWVGYTHQWRNCDPRFRDLVMASVESEGDAAVARAAGWRTFRVRRDLEEPLTPGVEVVCPASDEAGHRTTCEQCELCRGASVQARSVVIAAHGKPSTMRVWRRSAEGMVKA